MRIGISQLLKFGSIVAGRGACISLIILAAMVSAACLAPTAEAVDKAEAASGPPISIAMFVSTRTDACYTRGRVAATKQLAKAEQDRINASGGIHGRVLDVKILDDLSNPASSVANMQSALLDPTLLGMIGLSSSTRGKDVFEAVGAEIGASDVPFISDISVSSIFSSHANVYTTRPSQDEVRGPVMGAFTKAIGYQRPAFIGRAGVVYSDALGDALKKAHNGGAAANSGASEGGAGADSGASNSGATAGSGGLVADIRLPSTDGNISASALTAMVQNLQAVDPDVIYLSAGRDATPAIIKALTAAGLTPALFVTGRISSIDPALTMSYPNAFYELAWDDLPEVYNNRIHKLIATGNPAAWTFAGKKNSLAPGWSSGECKDSEPQNVDAESDPLDGENLRAITSGAQYADMVALIAAAARQAPRGADIKEMRREILKQLQSNYAAGRGAFKGTFENWSFDSGSRTATRMPFVVILPQGLGRTQLAPIQFLRARDGTLRRTETLYADIDMIKVHRIDDNEQSFFAEFYLSMRASDSASLDRIAFANAYIDPLSSKQQITIDTIHAGGASSAYPSTMKIYKVSGRFLYNPDLSNYPLDTQLFTIDLQPRSGDAPFIVQPPPLSLRDRNTITDGWDQVAQYVGTDEDFVPVVDAFTHAPSVVPFYTASFSWLLKRQTTDYIMRVVVPLGFILIVAYLSIFIPRTNFEAIVTIQVTALLSAVALYLALPALDSDTATLSDRMFVFVYMLVAAMIAISILRVNKLVASRKPVIWILDTLHVAGIPAVVAVASLYVWGLEIAGFKPL
ncbi:MAG: ABC transporter substrate-binding protein [Hyphomicrobiaceae bacterium]|nr:ABC transporter substrate-binding protein [Hyphomicrobiaceae bacterium]MCC0010894.1 ABC transporter substrate-binding protein [Hyphomicrobiaceae bacterium]